MNDTIEERTLDYLYRLLKKTRIDLGRAENRESHDETANLTDRVEILEHLISIVIARL